MVLRGVDKINACTPTIDYETYMKEWEEVFNFNYGQVITLKQQHKRLPEKILEYTHHVRRLRDETMPYVRQMLHLPQQMARDYWEKIKYSTYTQVLGPRVISGTEEMEEYVAGTDRGNYIIISNVVTKEVLFVWSPALDKTEAFAKHYRIFQYCFEKFIPKNSNLWKLWGVGETSGGGNPTDNSGYYDVPGSDPEGIHDVLINHFSGSFRSYIDDSLHEFYNGHDDAPDDEVSSHYEDVISELQKMFRTRFNFVDRELKLPSVLNYEDLCIKCPMIPKRREEFDPAKCYRYNLLPGTLGSFGLYDSYTSNTSLKETFSEPHLRNMTIHGSNVDEFAQLLTEIATWC